MEVNVVEEKLQNGYTLKLIEGTNGLDWKGKLTYKKMYEVLVNASYAYLTEMKKGSEWYNRLLHKAEIIIMCNKLDIDRAIKEINKDYIDDINHEILVSLKHLEGEYYYKKWLKRLLIIYIDDDVHYKESRDKLNLVYNRLSSSYGNYWKKFCALVNEVAIKRLNELDEEKGNELFEIKI